ncbi:MAG: hypothetical protein IKB20_06225 [Clostridia bacterium]|nr:hypothetical protein [Clostridia bacterium]
MFYIFISAIITTCISLLASNDFFSNSGSEMYSEFVPLIIAAASIICTKLLYDAQKGLIKGDTKWNKYKLKEDNILIRLKILKNNNDANWLLIFPFLIACIAGLVIGFLYFLYGCGVTTLNVLFSSAWFICISGASLFIGIIYYAIIREKISESYKNEKPDFVLDLKNSKDDNNQ